MCQAANALQHPQVRSRTRDYWAVHYGPASLVVTSCTALRPKSLETVTEALMDYWIGASYTKLPGATPLRR